MVWPTNALDIRIPTMAKNTTILSIDAVKSAQRPPRITIRRKFTFVIRRRRRDVRKYFRTNHAQRNGYVETYLKY